MTWKKKKGMIGPAQIGVINANKGNHSSPINVTQGPRAELLLRLLI